LLERLDRGQSAEMLTLIEAPQIHRGHVGEMLMVNPGGEWEGSIVEEEFSRSVLAEAGTLQGKDPIIYQIVYKGQPYRVFRNVLGADKRRAIILGGGHISQPLAQILGMIDYEVVVIDDRPEFANAQRFPAAQEILCKGFGQALAETVIDKDTAVIIVTRGHRHDLDCLKHVLTSGAGYIGMIGSRRKVKAALDIMEEEGADCSMLQQIYAPIGLEIGAQTPAEIAVSIVAEILSVFRGGGCLPLRDKERKENG
jgi:xanthine dehydrogenase accessory factor